ncbi:uncharacterized protein BO97DRAFT_479091 [Aspergillus homomorphus CBS 101889]|uniref:Uncharacterized protein n=1 Tax=Aspergillus homomorphus (strain CBS 101889) TaxID=1450537 RepID=A0A395HV80_ASPHC|nr:hypothetical protein BO97DRAFT_479091 [Aspergillus homomorphus CBS 101889]RAL10748.1 hypothetical protein BO97DRAFT_479091 [Aspergillus homomorphus CBS 101889]
MEELTEQKETNRIRQGAFSGPSGSEAAAAASSSATPTTPTTPTNSLPSQIPAQPSYNTFRSPHYYENTQSPSHHEGSAGNRHYNADHHPFSTHDPLYYHPEHRKSVSWSRPSATVIPPPVPVPLPDCPQEIRSSASNVADADLMPPPFRPISQTPQPTPILKPPTKTDDETLQMNLRAMLRIADRQLGACQDILSSMSQDLLRDLIHLENRLMYVDSLIQEDERQWGMLRRYGKPHRVSVHCGSRGDVHVHEYRYGRGRGLMGSRAARPTGPVRPDHRGGSRQSGWDGAVAYGRVSKNVSKNASNIGDMTGIAARIRLGYEELKKGYSSRQKAKENQDQHCAREGYETEIETEDDDSDEDYQYEKYEEED